MEDIDWKLLHVIGEEKSIHKAAERLYVSQPALTYRLHQLEKEFDTKLFSRTNKGVQFTAQGELLFQYSRTMIQKLYDVKSTIRSMNGKIQGTLRIGAFPTVSSYVLPDLWMSFSAKYPNIKLVIRNGLSYKIIQMLFSEEIHLGIIRGEYQGTAKKVLLKDDPMCLVSHETIAISDLPKLPRVQYITNSSHNEVIDEWWYERFTQPPQILIESDNINTCVKMIACGLGYGILSAECLRESSLQVQNILRQNGTQVSRKTWLIYRDSSVKIHEVKLFIDFIKNAYRPEDAMDAVKSKSKHKLPIDG